MMTSLLSQLRHIGVGVARAVELTTRHGRLVAVAAESVREGTLLAAVPETAALSSLCLTDNDRDGFFPPIDEFVECALRCMSVPKHDERRAVTAQVESLALAHFLAVSALVDVESWFSSRLVEMKDVRRRGESQVAPPDAALLALHQSLAQRFVTSPVDHLVLAAYFVHHCAVTKLPDVPPNPSKGTTTEMEEAAAPTSRVHLIPFVDILVGSVGDSSAGSPPNASLHRWTARRVREHLRSTAGTRSPESLRGARQHLVGKDDATPYFAVVADGNCSAGDQIALSASLRETSAVQRH